MKMSLSGLIGNAKNAIDIFAEEMDIEWNQKYKREKRQAIALMRSWADALEKDE